MRPWLRDMRLCMWLNPTVRVLCPEDMRPRSKDMGPQLRDMITWFRDMRSCMCAVHSWASMRSAAPGLAQRTTWPLTVITSHKLFHFWNFWDLGFRTWTDRQTDTTTVAFIYKIVDAYCK
jgi:hypothetical protein